MLTLCLECLKAPLLLTFFQVVFVRLPSFKVSLIVSKTYSGGSGSLSGPEDLPRTERPYSRLPLRFLHPPPYHSRLFLSVDTNFILGTK